MTEPQATNQAEQVWVFSGSGRRYPNLPGAIFVSLARAEEWITKIGASGMLTLYPIDISVYDWALQKGFFKPKDEFQRTQAFIGTFTCAQQQHLHYEDGTRLNGLVGEG